VSDEDDRRDADESPAEEERADAESRDEDESPAEQERADAEPRDEDERDDDDDGGSVIGNRSILSASPLIWILLVAAAGWAIFATVTSGSKPPKGIRAVVVPTSGHDRMLVALPCTTVSGSSGSSSGGSSGGILGGTSIVLPRDSGRRVVLVPGCQGGSSGAGGATGGSSSTGALVHVLAPGTPIPQPGSTLQVHLGGPTGPKPKVASVFTVPDTTDARIVVVVPCQGSKSASSGQPPTPPSSGHGVLVAPPCTTGSG
jgi:hypothetical protein